MPRVKKTDPSVRVEVQVPASVKDKVDMLLFSEIEGRVPFGARSALATQLFRNWVNSKLKDTDNAV